MSGIPPVGSSGSSYGGEPTKDTAQAMHTAATMLINTVASEGGLGNLFDQTARDVVDTSAASSKTSQSDKNKALKQEIKNINRQGSHERAQMKEQAEEIRSQIEQDN